MKFKLKKTAGLLLAISLVLPFAKEDVKADNNTKDKTLIETDMDEEILIPTCDMAILSKNANLYDKINGDIKKSYFNEKLIFQITKGESWSFIKIDNETFYVKNEDITTLPYVFEEMVDNDIRTWDFKTRYINTKSTVFEKPGVGELGYFDKYSKAYVIFEVGDYSLVNINGSTGYVETKNLNEFDFEYNEALKHPDRIDVNTYINFNKDTEIDNMTIEKWQKGYCLFNVGDKSLVKYEGKYYYVPTSNINILGDNFAEVDISEQKAYFFKNSEMLVDGDCVTGNIVTNPTNEGLFEVYEIDGGRYLHGFNNDGTPYEVWVDCFIVFDGNIGFHNVLYRTEPKHFNKDAYLKGRGTHGCVNMYKEDVLTMYNELKKSENGGYGYKVLVHK